MAQVQSERKTEPMTIDAAGVHYRILNKTIREAAARGIRKFILKNINGQRYIGTGLGVPVEMEIFGVPGSDLAAFAKGPKVIVHNNAQDAVGNTMDDGVIVIEGRAGDVAGFSMRGGQIFIRDDAGYRVGIHMKSYREKSPLLVVGGVAQDFLGEYMAGGTLLVLGLDWEEEYFPGRYIGTGMHGGEIILRGRVLEHQLGKEVKAFPLDDDEQTRVQGYVERYCELFGGAPAKIMDADFTRLLPISHRPYGRLYAY